MRRLSISFAVCVLLLRVSSIPADETVGADETKAAYPNTPALAAPANACPVVVLAQIPQGDGQSICVWQITNCGDGTSVGTINGACNATPCACDGANCTGVGPGFQPGLVRNVIDEGEGNTTRDRYLNVNRIVPRRTIPGSALLVPAGGPGTITTFGQGDWQVKYLKTLKLAISPSDIEFHVLYKIFKPTETNPDGMTDADTDQYVGFRVDGEPATAGEIVSLNYNSAEVVKLQLTTASERIEIGAKVPVTLTETGGGPVTLQKWFQVYGIYR